MIRTQIQLSEKQAKSLKKLADNEKVSVASLVRRGVDALLESSGEISSEERRRRALAVAGKFHSKKRDLGTEHDKYLAQAFGA